MKNIWFIALALLVLSSCGPDPRMAQLKIEEGQKLARFSNYSAAIEAFDEAIKHDPASHEAYFNRGSAYFNKRDYKKAVEDFLYAVELKPNFANAWFNLGQIMDIELDHDMACYYYKKAKESGRPNIGDYLKKCPQD